MITPGEHLGSWLAVMAIAGVAAVWNLRYLAATRPALDRLAAALGGLAILALVIGASLVVTEVTECAFAASSLACSGGELALVALTDLAVGAALVTLWLRSDACRAPRVVPATRRHRAMRW